MGLEEAMIYLGRCGPYQVITYLIIVVSMNLPTTWQLYGIVFEGPSVPLRFSCFPRPSDGFSPKTQPNSACEQYKLIKEINSSDVVEIIPNQFNQTVGNITYFYSKKEKIECSHFVYHPSLNGYTNGDKVTTIQQEWNLVCKNEMWVSWSQVVFTAGISVGAALCPPFGDYFGRKKLFFLCQFAMGICGLAMAFSPNLLSFCSFQFLTGGFSMANNLAGFVIACELFPKDTRSILSPLIYVFFAIGTSLLSLWAFIFPNWRHLQFAFSIPPLITLLYYPFCPESWRWLISKGRYAEVEKLLDKAARFNKLDPVPRHILYDKSDSIPNMTERKQIMWNYFKQPKLLMYTAAMCFAYKANNLVYYGLNLMSGALAGDPYLNFFILTIVEVISVAMAVIAVSIYGRRYPIMTFFFTSSIFLFIAVIFNTVTQLETIIGTENKFLCVTAFTILGKLCITSACCVILVYVQEIFPTFMRSTGIGIVAGVGNIGAVLSPLSLLSSNLDITKYWIPTTIFGFVSLSAGFFVLLLPETMGRELPSTIEDILHMPYSLNEEEKRKSRQTAWSIFKCSFKDIEEEKHEMNERMKANTNKSDNL
ncbi:DgyrCDS6789 [Dimorphilus gyrociliatus]|uniref:DgyrCDS6789 n=1 Tax=Dimorphilus gyrociliatus TaxID=2664684 RepID=A0A7I8VQP0_9ANNE|nr:DgyrCDS6789 [Dimorphilus gyrociliatus]